MGINYTHPINKDNADKLLTSLIACFLPQFLLLGAGRWWLYIAITVLMVVIYRKPEIYGRKRLKLAVVSAQLANFIGGISFYYLVNYRPVIVLTVAVFCLIFPIRWIILIACEINVERKQRALEGNQNQSG